jgi:lipopolysaccharide transport system permease protein
MSVRADDSRLSSPHSALGGLWRHRGLIRQFAWREFRSRYVGSYLGLCWSIVTPAVMLVIYTFVFRGILHVHWGSSADESPLAFAVNLFGGWLIYNLFAEVVSRSPHLLISQPQFVKKVVFPVEILPVTTTVAALGHALMALSVVGVTAALLVRWPSCQVLWLPVLLLPYLALLLGVSWFAAALGTFWRDLGPAITIGLHALIFLTPVFYPLQAVPGKWQPLMRLNPLAIFIENTRRVWSANRPPLFGEWSVAALISLLVMTAGYWWFQRCKRDFADVV